jgi:putative heme-binding domain-containing protein
MELVPDGATYQVTQREFLKLREPDAHLTDVLEDRDGSLLVVDTGGWFRIGCPASVMAKPDIAGAIYRIRKSSAPARVEPWGRDVAKVWELARKADAASVRELTSLLADKDVSIARAAGNALASLAKSETEPNLVKALTHANSGVQLAAAHALGEMSSLDEKTIGALLKRLEGEVDRSIEHQAMFALVHAGQTAPLAEALRNSHKPALQRRALVMLAQLPKSRLSVTDVLPLIESRDAALARTAANVAAKHQEWMPAVCSFFSAGLNRGTVSADALSLLETAVKPWLAERSVVELVSILSESTDAERQRSAWRILASANSTVAQPRCVAPLKNALATAAPADLPLLLNAIANLHAPELNAALKEFSADDKRALNLRLKALSACLRADSPLAGDTFRMLLSVLDDQTSASARLEAAHIITTSKLTREQLLQLASTIRSLGPLELREAARAIRSAPDAEVGNAFATALTKNVALASFQESEIRSLFSNLPSECFAIVAPALHELAAEDDARRRKLETLPSLIAERGRATEGRKIFETGKGACTACHRIGNVGNLVGPDLSTIGQIRAERDILESIFFPSATLARDYEAHTIETADGQSLVAVIRRNLPDAIVVVDASAQEHTLPRAQITSMQTLPTSLMPTGLDHSLTEEELLDLVAFLRSCK